jgi:hypothetical protein
MKTPIFTLASLVGSVTMVKQKRRHVADRVDDRPGQSDEARKTGALPPDPIKGGAFEIRLLEILV